MGTLTLSREEALIIDIQHGGAEYVNTARMCLEKGADPNGIVKNSWGLKGVECFTSPMHEAAKQPQTPQYMQDLLEYGGDPSLIISTYAARDLPSGERLNTLNPSDSSHPENWKRVVMEISAFELAKTYNHPFWPTLEQEIERRSSMKERELEQELEF